MQKTKTKTKKTLYRHFSVIRSQLEEGWGGEEDLCECVYKPWWSRRQIINNTLLHVLLKKQVKIRRQYITNHGLEVVAVQDQSLHHPHHNNNNDDNPACHVSPGGLVRFTVCTTQRLFWTILDYFTFQRCFPIQLRDDTAGSQRLGIWVVKR